MTNSEEKQNSGFIFGLTLGAAIGALSAVLINKNSETEVVQNFESKVKEFFQDLISNVETKKEKVVKKVEYLIEDNFHESEPIIIKKKPAPKMFVKAKR